MRFLFTFALALLLSLPSWSQYESAIDSDPVAIKLLKKIKNQYLSTPAYQIDFIYDIELPGQATESQKGKLIQSGDNFRLEIADREIISDNETVWMFLSDMNEVQINDADFDDSEDFMSPSDVFSLDESKDFIFAISNHSKEEGKAITQIEGKPVDSDSDYSKMRLTIADKGTQVKRLKIFAKDGSRFTMHISAVNLDYQVSDDTFSFNPALYPDVTVEDLRF